MMKTAISFRSRLLFAERLSALSFHPFPTFLPPHENFCPLLEELGTNTEVSHSLASLLGREIISLMARG